MTRPSLAAARIIAAIILTLSLNAAADLDEARRLAERGDTAAALRAVDNHLKASPDDIAGRFLRARLLTDSGRREAAAKLYRELAVELPDRPEPHNNLAALYAEEGEVERAREALLAALATHPSYAATFDNLQALHAHLAGIAYRRALGNGEGAPRAPLRLATLPAIHDLPAPPPVTVAAAEPQPAPIPAIKPTPKPAPVAAPAKPEPKPAKPATDPARGVLDAVKGWASAWSNKDVAGYLAHYAADYRPADMNRRRWVAQRKLRLSKPRTIQVTLKELRVRITGEDSAEALFEQRYRADTYKDRVRKQLTLKRGADGWKIVAEKTLAVLG